MPVDGIGVTYLTAGFLLVYGGYKNVGLKNELTSFLKGKPPQGNPTGPVQVGLQQIGGTTATGTGAAGSPSIDVASSGFANELSVARYLVANGYTPAAAAGIASCIEGESGGNPESSGSGGDGLIGLMDGHLLLRVLR